MKRCKICHIEAELTDGRCHSCQMAKEATDHHMTYGKYVAMIEASKSEPKVSKSRSVPGWKLCPSCGKKFYATHGNAKYCSALCSADAHYKMHREQIEKRKKPIEPKICAECGKEYMPLRNDPRIKFCSAQCCAAASNRAKRERERVKREQERLLAEASADTANMA